MAQDRIPAADGAWITNAGRIRDRNEDSLVIDGEAHAGISVSEPRSFSVLGGEPWTIAVIDGIGGQNGGMQASAELAVALAGCHAAGPEDVRAVLESMNRNFYEQTGNPDRMGMGAAVAGLVCGNAGLAAFNVGDCRVYRERDGFLAQITRDDTLVQTMVDIGEISEDQIRPETSHRLTQSVGGRPEFRPIETHVHPLRITAPSRFLICSDGLTDMVSLDEMEEIVRTDVAPCEAVANLFKTAMKAGGADNCTVVVLDVSPAPDPYQP